MGRVRSGPTFWSSKSCGCALPTAWLLRLLYPSLQQGLCANVERKIGSVAGAFAACLLPSIICSTRPRCICRPPCCRFCHCSKVLAAIGKEVKEFYGGNHSQAALTQTTGVIVCTIEKANIM